MYCKRATSWAVLARLNSNTLAIWRKGFNTGANWLLQIQMIGRLVRPEDFAEASFTNLMSLWSVQHTRKQVRSRM